MVTRKRSYEPRETLDEGEWLRLMLALVLATTQSLPDSETVARIRERLLYQIEDESISLVA